MAERTFRSPGVFEREIDLTTRSTSVSGTPAGVVGTAEKGPAFVPKTIGSISEFKNMFGKLSAERFGPYAAEAFLKNQSSLTYVRVLGAGANLTLADISNTVNKGTVKNAGFRLSGSVASVAPTGEVRDVGAVQFLAGIHSLDAKESVGFPVFTNNQSKSQTTVQLIRSMVLLASGARMEVMNDDEAYPAAGKTADDTAYIRAYDGTPEAGMFKLVLSSALGTAFSNDEQKSGIRIYSASLDPSSIHYVGKILNKDPDKFGKEQHLLYADFPVESEIAKIKKDSTNDVIAVVSGSYSTSTSGGDSSLAFREIFGSFNTRYKAAKSTYFISQPFGEKEYNLFYFEALDDGESGNLRTKISITNLKRSTDSNNPYGTFTVEVRDYYDSDINPAVIERYPLCTLNPDDENYIGSKIGDLKIHYNFDAESEDEQRLNITGKRVNKSNYVRVIMSEEVESKLIPQDSLPFGFRGLPLLKTSDTLTDSSTLLSQGAANPTRLSFNAGSSMSNAHLKYAIVPPVPFTFKTTKNKLNSNSIFSGFPGQLELADPRLYWGIKTSRTPVLATTSDPLLRSNDSSDLRNELIDSYSKMLGIIKLDALVTGSGADSFHNNKFTLAKVALNNQSNAAHNLETAITNELTGTAATHIREAAYIRNGVNLSPNYTINDKGTYTKRLTFGSLVASNSAIKFNQYTEYMKFTNILYGGFDGVNILDKDQRNINDKASSQDAGGKASNNALGYENLSSISSPGAALENNAINSYRAGIKIITDPMESQVNIVVIPGIRDANVTDYAIDKVNEYSKAIYLMDIKNYDSDSNRLYDDDSKLSSVRKTIEQFEGRNIDNSYVATYFPDVVKLFSQEDGGTVSLPSSVAAIGALGYNDAVSFPWFAPAGFNRGALENIANTKVRLNTEDRNLLYEARINPIANFNINDYVIFGQKTLQKSKSALDRVNVRRMLLEVKRIVSKAANNIIFEQNVKATRDSFIANVSPKLSLIQSQQGIEQFKVIMNDTNNSQSDIEQNKLNGRIVLVPTRAVEFIALDFIITNSGVSFE
jgi:hypothetical protein